MRTALLPIVPLASDEPLESRLTDARLRQERATGVQRIESALEASVLAALRGKMPEAEAQLAAARAQATPELKGTLELASALVMREAGYAARMAGALERGEAVPGLIEEPATRALSQLFHAQLLLLTGTPPAAVRAAMEGLASLPPQAVGSPLAVYAHLVTAECLLEAGEVAEAAARLEQAAHGPGLAGVLAARADMLRVRAGLLQGRTESEHLRHMLDRAIARLTRLGASRELALAYLTYAQFVAVEDAGAPAAWLARAHQLLLKVGTAGDLRQLRQAFRLLGRREVDHLADSGMVGAMEALRERHARLRDILSAQRDARIPGQRQPTSLPQPLAKTVDESLESMRLAEEELIGTLEQTLLDRERLSQLVAVSQELVSIEDLGELLDAVPRLILAFILGVRATLLEERGAGALLRCAGDALPHDLPERLHEVAATALREGRLQVLHEPDEAPPPLRPSSTPGGRYALLPLRSAERRLVLFVGRTERRVPLDERDLEHLSLFRSLASTAIARILSSSALQQAAARDAATLAAIRDGILTLDQGGCVRAMNQAAARLLRVKQEQVVGHRLRDIAALDSLAEALGSGKPLTDEVVALAHGDVLVRSQTYEGGVVATLQELATAQRLAHKLVGTQARFTFEDLVGQDPTLLACLEDARLAAQSDVPILITGESGTGKEMLAQAIHRASPSAALPFIGVNVAAFPRELLESELFGYERGAFTGARAGGNPGKFELADRGTLLLDEIGDMPLEMQVKLLRVLQERMLQRLGSTRDIPILARVIATTHRDLEDAVEEGSFRLDLFHRLRVVHLRLPPLRERPDDIPLLVEHHLRRYALRTYRRSLRVAPPVMDAFQAYPWPGNVRELANLLEGVVSLLPAGQDTIHRIPPVIERALERARPRAPEAPAGGAAPDTQVLPFKEVERRAFEHALRQFSGNVARAAKALGVSKGTFYSKIRRYGLDAPKPEEEPPPVLSVPGELLQPFPTRLPRQSR